MALVRDNDCGAAVLYLFDLMVASVTTGKMIDIHAGRVAVCKCDFRR